MLKLLHYCTRLTCQQILKTQQWPQDWKGQFSFQSQKRAMPKNVQTTMQLHSFNKLARLYSKSFKLGFSSTWTENLQMYKLDLEKVERPANICWVTEKAREFQKYIYFFFIDYTKEIHLPLQIHLLLLHWLHYTFTVWITTNWKILQEMGIPDHLTCLLRNLHEGQEATVMTEHGTMDWKNSRKGVWQGCVLSPCLINLYAECIIQNARLGKQKLESRLLGEISTTPDM